MDNVLKLHANTVIDYLARSHGDENGKRDRSANYASETDINWVLARWPIEPVCARTLTDENYQLLKKEISQAPTGKQKFYRRALNDILIYLHDVAKWQLPGRTDPIFIDRDLIWFSRLSEQAEVAYTLLQAYESDKSTFLQTRITQTPAQAALTIAIDVAPLSLSYLASVLSDNNALERRQQQSALKVTHLLRPSGNYLQVAPYFTRYHLTLYSYRYLHTYYQKNQPEPMTAGQLLNALNTHVSAAPYHLARYSADQWYEIFQILWHYRDNVPPTLLKDMAQPERHVDFDPVTPLPQQKKRALKKIYQQNKWIEYKLHNITPSVKPRWKQRQLIKHWAKGGDVQTFPLPALNANNILEHYLFLYCRELILFGGVIKERLAEATFIKYCNIEANFAGLPLRYDAAIDHEQLQEWAKQVYEKQESDTHRSMVHYFFRFISTQALTDHFDIDEFDSPCMPPTVDPYRISLSSLHEIIDALLTQPGGSLIQRFYCAVAAILCYFAKLRRGEIIRLRIKDIHFLKSQMNSFHLIITNTAEGDTKSRTTRPVHIVLPASMAKLVRIAIHLKQDSPYNSPLIGFDGEKVSSRQLNYLLPVTCALKAVCGQAARLHHLRKSGIHLSMEQSLQLAYQYPEHDLGEHADLQSQLTPEIVRQSFAYWIEEGEEQYLNDNLLFDEFCKQIGHRHYTTTRWSYLHGTQWLFPYLRPQHCGSALQRFSHAELRFLLDLAPDSNDLSRQLMLMSEDYKNSSVGEKQNNPVRLTESALRQFLWPNKSKNNVNQIATKVFNDANFYLKRWMLSAKSQHDHFLDNLFITMQQEKAICWPALSEIWKNAGKHNHASLSKKQRTALSALGKITLIPGEIENAGDANSGLPAMQIQIAGNVKNASNFATVFRSPEWQWLACTFALTVNRKTNSDRLLALVKTHYAQANEPIAVIRKGAGASCLTITLTPKFPLPDSMIKQTLHYLQPHLNSQEKTKHA